MTIHEAAQLVVQAGALGKGGEIFLLDMGEPVKIVDLARKLIRLSGFIPEKDIKIEFSGIRPGEKMVEELLTGDEGINATIHRRIFSARVAVVDTKVLNKKLKLFQSILNSEPENIITYLKESVSEYQSLNLHNQYLPENIEKKSHIM
jgi:FlaA1/EpsC-like NDP-sugar epimerase